MTAHRSPKPLAGPGRPVGRAVTVALVLSALAGPGRIGGMLRTVLGRARWNRPAGERGAVRAGGDHRGDHRFPPRRCRRLRLA